MSSAGEGQSVAGQVGTGGPKVELVADHGDIDITRMDAPPVPPEPPLPPVPLVPPLPPAPGAKSLRHFRPSKDANGEPPAQPVVQ